MTAKILPFATCPAHKANAAQPRQPGTVISYARCREKRRRRLEKCNVLVQHFKARAASSQISV